MIRNNLAVSMLRFALCTCLSPLLAAQQSVHPALPEADFEVPSTLAAPRVSETMPATINLQATNQVVLRLEMPVSSATAQKGDRIRFTALNDFSPNRKVVIPAGTTLYSTVSHVRPKTRHRSGDIKFSDPELDLGNGQRIRLTTSDGDDFSSPGAIPVIVVGAVTIGPLVVATSPIWLSELVIHDIRERRFRSLAHTPKPDLVDKDFLAGDVLTYYTRNDSRIRPDGTAASPSSQPADPPLQSAPANP
jgi:hypothetical protein